MVLNLATNGYQEWVSEEIEKKLFPIFDIARITDEEMWAEIRGSMEIPHVGNVYTNMVFNKIKDAVEDKYGLGSKLNVEVNDIASSFYVNDIYVTTAQEFMEELEELHKEKREEIDDN